MLAKRLRDLRKRAGLTQQALAKAANVSQQTITKIETGAATESRKLVQIAHALNVSVEELTAGPEGAREPALSYHGVMLTRAGALLAAEWEKLDVNDRAEIEGEILARVAAKRRRAKNPHKHRDS